MPEESLHARGVFLRPHYLLSDGEIELLVRSTVRLIEFMDVGNVNHWDRELVVPSADLLKLIHDRWPLMPVAAQSSAAAPTACRNVPDGWLIEKYCGKACIS